MKSQEYLICICIQYVLSGANDINEGVPWKLQRCLQCPLCLHESKLHVQYVHLHPTDKQEDCGVQHKLDLLCSNLQSEHGATDM